MFSGKRNMTELGNLISPAQNEKCGDNVYPVLSMTMHQGLVLQSDKFKKTIASKDRSEYKVVRRGQLVVGFPIDEGVLAAQRIVDTGIVSPAYNIWNIDQGAILPHFLEYALRCDRAIDYYKSRLRGSTARRRSLSKESFLQFRVPVPSISEQQHILHVLRTIEEVLSMQKQQLEVLDTLIKARFVEMFGDPVSNPMGWEKRPLAELADIKIGPFGSLLHKEDYIEGGHPLVNPSHIQDGQIVTDKRLTISDEKYEELSAYKLEIGDVVLGRRGEMGRCAVVTEDGLLCGTGSLLIRTKGDVTADYIQKIISFPSFKRTIEDMAVGQTMPNLNAPIVSGFEIACPDKAVQSNYYAFVSEVDKSKAIVQKALDEAQLLFDSLMQEYFG